MNIGDFDSRDTTTTCSEIGAFLVDPNDLVLGKVICDGAGSTATVYLALYKDGLCAVKQMKDMVEIDEQVIERELNVLTAVDHPNMVKLYGIVEGQNPVQICLEYCAGGSLFELLHYSLSIPVSWRQRLTCLTDTAMAMDYLHSFDPKIVHRDLKSLNILLLEPVLKIEDKPHVKVCDFGFAREYETGANMTMGAGTLHWMAPEVSSMSSYTEAADIFSFAIVGFEVVSRHVPMLKVCKQNDGADVFHKAIQRGERPDIKDARFVPARVPNGLVDLIVKCWSQEPHQRPPFNEIWQSLKMVTSSTPDDVKNHAPPLGHCRSI